MTLEQIIEKQVETYNARDLEGYMALFHPDVEIFDFPGALLMRGAGAVRERYGALFRDKPQNCMVLHDRHSLGNRIIDHETVYRDGPDGEAMTLVTVYEIQDGLIKRVDFIRRLD